MENTTKLGLKKPSENDFINIQDLNDNADILDKILNLVYPVGAIYISVNNVDPSILFGGTWEKIQGRFLIGSGTTSNTSYNYELGQTGGNADAVVISHTHSFSGSTNNTGGHTHTFWVGQFNKAGTSTNIDKLGFRDTHYRTTATDTAGSHSHTYSGTTGNTGSAGNQKNLPPYLVVNMWKRTL